MIYKFKEQDAYDFAKSIFAPIRRVGDELRFTQYCPYCKGGDHHDKNTFSINLTTGQFKCLRSSCSAEGNFITLARDFNFSLGREVDEYYQSRKRYRKLKTPAAPILPKPKAIEYLKSRGISEETAKKYQITVHNKYDNVLVFPFFDEEGKMQFVKYRKTDFDPEKDKGKEWCEANCKPILFGMSQCNDKFDRLIICEGQLDSLSVAESGIENAVSVPTGAKGFTWVPYCWDWFSKFQEMIVFGDYEKGEITLLEDLQKRFPNTIKHVREEDYKGCKDANEILTTYGPEAVRNAVENAIPIPVKRVKELADVKTVDLYSITKIPTGIRQLDNILTGGLYQAQVILVTGKRGGGKSTFCNQLAVNALKEMKKVFIYSGELQDFYCKRWIDFQIAGRKNIIVNDNHGYKSYLVTNSNIDKINDWYRGRAFIYDNNIIEDDELEDLVGTIQKSVMQYGIDVVLIDNLMTALDLDMEIDEYRAQSKFMKKLCRMAKRLDIVIIVVAHPRKNGTGGDENDEVSGSANITNLVDVVMTYKKDKDLLDNQRLLTVSKNRLTGKVTGPKGITLFYDEASKRIIDSSGDFDESYGWESSDGFISLEDYGSQESIPFDNDGMVFT